jgi:type VI secretion system protein ImpB
MANMQGFIGRVRPPRVHITYEVEVGGALEVKEVPFVVGVLADLSGDPRPKNEAAEGTGLENENAAEKREVPWPWQLTLRDRRFAELNPDNFNHVFKSQGVYTILNDVKNVLNESGGSLSAHLKFNSFSDLEPRRVAEQIDVLKPLLVLRDLLTTLDSDLETNADLDATLQLVMEKVVQMKSERPSLNAPRHEDAWRKEFGL